jgi:hypothetical protein
MSLNSLFTIWLVCAANYQTLQNVTNADIANISNKTGVASNVIANLITTAKTLNVGQAVGATPLESAAAIFQQLAVTAAYVPPIGGRACGTVGEILGGI